MIIDILNEKIKKALIEKDVITKNCLKSVKAKAQAIAKENKTDVLSDEIMIKALKKELKELDQVEDILGEECLTSSDAYKEVCIKLSLVKSLLPMDISDEELKEKIKTILKTSRIRSDATFGEKMKLVMPCLGPNADGKRVSNIIKNL